MPFSKVPESNLRRVDPQFRVTLPPAIRTALKVGQDDLVGFVILDDGEVCLRKASVSLEKPKLSRR